MRPTLTPPEPGDLVVATGRWQFVRWVETPWNGLGGTTSTRVISPVAFLVSIAEKPIHRGVLTGEMYNVFVITEDYMGEGHLTETY